MVIIPTRSLCQMGVGELVRNIQVQKEKEKFVFRWGGGGEGVYEFSSQIFWGDLSFLDFGGGGGGGRGGLSFLSRSEFLGLSSKV